MMRGVAKGRAIIGGRTKQGIKVMRAAFEGIGSGAGDEGASAGGEGVCPAAAGGEAAGDDGTGQCLVGQGLRAAHGHSAGSIRACGGDA